MPKLHLFALYILSLMLWFIELSATETSKSMLSVVKTDRYARFIPFVYEGIKEIGTVSGFIQDRNGYIWMSGEKGLGRFDGFRFKVYKADSIPGSLPSSVIQKLKLDQAGNVWVASNGGLSKYVYEKDCFEAVYGKFQISQTDHNKHAVRAFLFQGDSLIWLASEQHALLLFDRSKHETKIVIENHGIDQPYYRYHHLEYVSENLLIFGGRSRGPFLYNSEIDTLIQLPVDNRDLHGKKRENDVSVILRKNNDEFWIGGFDGLYTYSIHQNTFSKVWKGSVYDMLQDNTGNYWVATGNGLLHFEPASGIATRYQHNKDDPQSLGGTRIYSVFQERSGRIWIGHNNGVSTYQVVQGGVEYFFHIPGDINTPSSSSITALSEAGENSFWIGTSDAGLNLIDLTTDKIQHFTKQQRKEILSDNIRCLINDNKGNLYIGYWAGLGFARYNISKNKFENYTFNSQALLDDWYNDFALAENGHLWLGFWGGPGLTLFDPKKETFDNQPAGYLQDAYLSRRIEVLFTDKKNRLWIGTTQSGIQLLDRGSKQAITYFSKQSPSGGFNEQKVTGITQTADGIIMASSYFGLYHFDEEKNIFQKIEFQKATSRWKFTTSNLIMSNCGFLHRKVCFATISLTIGSAITAY